MIDPFLVRALLAGIGLAIISAPLGSVVVWNRMSYFGETVAHACLLGIALGLFLNVNLTFSVLLCALFTCFFLVFFERVKFIPFDSALGLTHHGALALGIFATSLLGGGSVDLLGYLFGDIFSVTNNDLWIILTCGSVLLSIILLMWQSLLRIALNEELALAEGVPVKRVKTGFILILGVAIAIAIKIVGTLLTISFLIVPVVAARPLSKTPEHVVLIASLIGILSVFLGMYLSYNFDVPGGAAIVLSMIFAAIVSLCCFRGS